VDAIVVTGGDPPPKTVIARLPDAACVIAADSGLEHARNLGLAVDLVVGDLDSVDPDVLAAAEQDGAAVERHPPEKDATDVELALDAAVARGARNITVVGGYGGRVDHFLANALGLAADRYAGAAVDAWIGRAYVNVVRDHVELRGAPGSLVTLLPVGGPTRGITTTGLRYPLDDEELTPGTSRGVSNELLDDRATVTLRSGVLITIQPDALALEGDDDA
jgi:thiamine pyrophosphokinase